MVERIYPDNTSDVFGYDQAGNLTGTSNSNIAYYYSYDLNNRLTGVTSSNLAQIFNIEYQYDIMGNRKAMTIKKGTSTPRTINYEYNTNNQMTKIISDMGNFTFAYDSLNRRIKRTLPNSSYTTYVYDQLSRLTNITHKNAFNQTIDSFGYTYDNVGNRITKAINDGTITANTINYNYDQIYRLTKATPKSKNPLINLLDDILKLNTEAYSYDPVGNRQTGPKSTDGYTYDDGNEQLTYKGQTIVKDNIKYEYDANGNLIKKTEIIQGLPQIITTYAYDDENRLTDVKIQQGNKIKEVSFAYDPFGRRISKTLERDDFADEGYDKDNHNDNDKDKNHDSNKDKDRDAHGRNDYPQTTYYVYDEQNVIAEYDDSRKQTASYVYGPNIDEPLAAEINNNRIYYHADGIGSITSLTNYGGNVVQKYRYDSFGNIQYIPFPIWIKQPYMYTGREFDYDAGLYYYRARYYDPQAGRFITKDPISFAGGDVNLYAYVGNNPVHFNDPLGLDYYSWFRPNNLAGIFRKILNYFSNATNVKNNPVSNQCCKKWKGWAARNANYSCRCHWLCEDQLVIWSGNWRGLPSTNGFVINGGGDPECGSTCSCADPNGRGQWIELEEE